MDTLLAPLPAPLRALALGLAFVVLLPVAAALLVTVGSWLAVQADDLQVSE